MEINNLLEFSDRKQLHAWLQAHHTTEKEVWVAAYRSQRKNDLPQLPYLEVVEEALCFGWIDSTNKRLPDGRLAQRLSPRRKGSHWTELNVQRCHSLIDRGLMTEAGLQAMPKTTSCTEQRTMSELSVETLNTLTK